MEGGSLISGKLKFVELVKTKISQVNSAQKAIAAANQHNLIFVCSGPNAIKAVSSQILSEGRSDVEQQISLTFRPTLLTVARYGFSSVLLVAGFNETQNCPVIEAFIIDNLESIGRLVLTELGCCEIVDYAWNPNYFESIVALCTNNGHLLIVALDKKTKGVSLVYRSQQYGALTCCWSPKGKNLALGTQNGKILRLEPVISSSGFTFKEVANSILTLSCPKISPSHQVVKLRWLNRTFLLCVHARLGNPKGTDTIYSVITVKPSKPFNYWSNICFENQVQSNYTVHLVNLTNVVVCASSASGEAAVVGVDGAEAAKSNELKDWSSIVIDEEGARIELPLDANNRETYPIGATTAFLKNNKQPIIVFCTSDGYILPYLADHHEGILKLPEFQQPLDCPINVPKSSLDEVSSLGSILSSSILSPPKLQLSQTQQSQIQQPAQNLQQQSPQNLQQASFQSSPLQQSQFQPLPALKPPQFTPSPFQSIPAPTLGFGSSKLQQQQQQQPLSLKTSSPASSLITSQQNQQAQVALPKVVPESSSSEAQDRSVSITSVTTSTKTELLNSQPSVPLLQPSDLSKEIENIKNGIKYNQEYLSLLEEVNRLRTKFDGISEIHTTHREVFQVVKHDIESLDLGMLENLYLIEYIKGVSQKKHPSRALDPMLLKKVESIKVKSRSMAERIKELNDLVDMSWENYSRGTKKRRISSLDIIYQTLATNHKIIALLKKKAAGLKSLRPEESPVVEIKSGITIRELQLPKQRALRELLSSRSTVPVRRAGLNK